MLHFLSVLWVVISPSPLSSCSPPPQSPLTLILVYYIQRVFFRVSQNRRKKNRCGHCCESWTVKASVYRNVTFKWRKAEKKTSEPNTRIHSARLLVCWLWLCYYTAVHCTFSCDTYTNLYVFHNSHCGFFCVCYIAFRPFRWCSTAAFFCHCFVCYDHDDFFFPPVLLCYSIAIIYFIK